MLQSKLIKLFSKQIVAKARLRQQLELNGNGELPRQLQEFPKTDQWLGIVGLSDQVINVSVQRWSWAGDDGRIKSILKHVNFTCMGNSVKEGKFLINVEK